MNWGKGIVAVLAIFVAFIVILCVYMVASPTDDFDHQYYEKGLNFNHDYNRELQVTKDHAQPLIQVGDKLIRFIFTRPVKGTIKFMRPSSNAPDKVYPLNSDNGKEVDIPIEPFAAGRWQLEFEWVSNNNAYLYHQEIYIK
jgi:hypothetical protein